MRETCFCGRTGDIADREPVYLGDGEWGLACLACGHLDRLELFPRRPAACCWTKRGRGGTAWPPAGRGSGTRPDGHANQAIPVTWRTRAVPNLVNASARTPPPFAPLSSRRSGYGAIARGENITTGLTAGKEVPLRPQAPTAARRQRAGSWVTASLTLPVPPGAIDGGRRNSTGGNHATVVALSCSLPRGEPHPRAGRCRQHPHRAGAAPLAGPVLAANFTLTLTTSGPGTATGGGGSRQAASPLLNPHPQCRGDLRRLDD